MADSLMADPPAHVIGVEVAGPGFVNFRLDPGWLHELIATVLTAGPDYGRDDSGVGTRVMVEYVSANPTGPAHAGHARGAVFGDSLARLLRFVGHEVSDEFYVNDRGVQMQTFAQSLAARAAGAQPPDGGYMGQYFIDWAAQMPADADPLVWGEAHALADQQSLGAKFREIGVVLGDLKFTAFLVLLGVFFWLPFWAFFNLCALYVDKNIDTVALYDSMQGVFGTWATGFFSDVGEDGRRRVLGETISHTGWIIMIFQIFVSRVSERYRAMPTFMFGLGLAALGFFTLGYARVGAPALVFAGIAALRARHEINTRWAAAAVLIVSGLILMKLSDSSA